MEMKKKSNARQSANFKKNAFEIDAWANNLSVVGIDEVGRGCLAGPVVTAAVIVPPHTKYALLKDSKIMSCEDRNKAFKWIQKNCVYGVGVVHHRIIDKHNIWQSTLIAMKKALMNVMEQSTTQPSAVLVDAMPLDISDTHLCNIPVHYFYHGEKKSSSIAAASIVAKVTRDALMTSLDSIIPGYKWMNNKGYATQDHQNALKQHSHSIIHRLRFLKKVSQQDVVEQQLLFDTVDNIIKEIGSDETESTLCGGN